MVANNIISQELISQSEYLSDCLLINLLDQIWIQEMYEPHQNDVTKALEIEIRACHDLDRVEELIVKRPTLLKACKLIKATELN